MRIVYLSTDPGIPFGAQKGASVHLGHVADALAAEGHDVLVLVPEVSAAAAPGPGVTVATLPGSRRRASTADRLASEEQLAAWLAERLREFRADALYERFALHTAAGGHAARAAGVVHLVELNAPLIEEAARYRSLDEPLAAARLEASTLSGADVVLAVSPPLVAYAAERGARRALVLQNAADLPARASDHARQEATAVFAGSLRPWHGIDTIAHAWQLLGSDAPPLLVIGAGPARDALRGPRVTFVGSVGPDEVSRLLAGTDIGLAPYGPDSPRYFSPLKVFEYLAAGLATVVGDLPAVRDLVTAESAVIIPAGDAHALTDAVGALAADPERRRTLGRNGRALIAAGHTWRHRARRIVELVNEVAPVGSVG